MDDFGEDGEPEGENGVSIRFYVPPEQEAGVYAETVAVWHTPYDFVIDFGSIQIAQPSDPDDPASPFEVPARVVSRVRIPTGLVFDVIRTINARMEQYEAEWGEIRGPEFREGDTPE
jgi:hypothetical protein